MGNQVPQIKLCDINNPLPRPLGGGQQALWDAVDRSRPRTLAAVSFPRTELRPPEPPAHLLMGLRSQKQDFLFH